MTRSVQLVLVEVRIESQQLLYEHPQRDFPSLSVDGLLEHLDDVFTHLCLDMIKNILEVLDGILDVFWYLVVLKPELNLLQYGE